jgi:sortase (surface protein transpeptidase)
MDVPVETANVGWFEPGYVPGKPGSAVMTGHIDGPGGKRAVFWLLDQLQPGDEILVEMDSGVTYTYHVDRSRWYPFDTAPIGEIFGWSEKPHLNLITCSGKWNKEEEVYETRLVVYAQLTIDD